MRLSVFFILSVFALNGSSLSASDFLYEQEIVDGIVASGPAGEIAWLNVGDRPFLGLYMEATTKIRQGAALIFHGVAGHPDSNNIIRPLRTRLPTVGWSTLAIQMPVLRDNKISHYSYSLIPEARERIKAALDFIKKDKIENLVLIGHGFGGTTALSFQFENPDDDVKALVVIGLPVFQNDTLNPVLLDRIGKVDLPLLDIYGSVDIPQVLKTADRRKQVAKKNLAYRQVRIDGADHYFRSADDALVKTVYGWIKRLAPGAEIKK